ncbi:MAG: carbon-nitrogen hydrolase family protein [Bacillota bacterium]
MNKVKVSLIQMLVIDSKEKNLKKAEEMIKKAAQEGAKLVVLPEMFNCPYDNKYFPLYAEREGDLSWEFLSRIARENKIFLVGGSIPEIDEEKHIYNTSFVFDPKGQQIAKHRKMHLFDIDIKGGQYFKESDTLTSGKQVTVFDTPYGRLGLMICYDLRFPELSRVLAHRGTKFIVVPAAFNMTTGPAHWELLFRTRALDNQVYILGAAPARDVTASYVSYGNSLIADPWGTVLKRLSGEENILIEELDLTKIEKVREELPLLKHLRKDVYCLTELSN